MNERLFNIYMSKVYFDYNLIDGPILESENELKYLSNGINNEFILHFNKVDKICLLSIEYLTIKSICSMLELSQNNFITFMINWINTKFNIEASFFEIIY